LSRTFNPQQESRMPVIDRRGKPLPPTHPFATPRVVFGRRRPQRLAEMPPQHPDSQTLPNVGGGKSPTMVAAKNEQADE
jgi:hypothetical protein